MAQRLTGSSLSSTAVSLRPVVISRGRLGPMAAAAVSLARSSAVQRLVRALEVRVADVAQQAHPAGKRLAQLVG